MFELDIGIGVFERIAHPGLCGEVDDAGEVLVGRDQGEHAVAIGDVELGKDKIWQDVQLGEPRLLQPRVVIVVDVVDADDAVTAVQQSFGGMEADKPGNTGDEDRHEAPVNWRPPALSFGRDGGKR